MFFTVVLSIFNFFGFLSTPSGSLLVGSLLIITFIHFTFGIYYSKVKFFYLTLGSSLALLQVVLVYSAYQNMILLLFASLSLCFLFFILTLENLRFKFIYVICLLSLLGIFIPQAYANLYYFSLQIIFLGTWLFIQPKLTLKTRFISVFFLLISLLNWFLILLSAFLDNSPAFFAEMEYTIAWSAQLLGISVFFWVEFPIQILENTQQPKIIDNPILGEDDLLQKFDNAFVYHRPLSTIDGDFLWTGTLNISPSPLQVVVVADCTGSGETARYLKNTGQKLLEKIIKEKRSSDPAQILSRLDELLILELENQNLSSSGVIVETAISMSLILIDERDDIVYFAGAGAPIFYVRQDKVYQLKGTRFLIGTQQRYLDKVFETTTLDLQEGDILFLFTDGYANQLGGETGSRFMRKYFKKLLLENNQLPLSEQKAELEREFLQWKGNHVQTDDAMVVGIQFI